LGKIQLSKKSKKKIILRVLLLFLVFIYIPMESIFSWKFQHMEHYFIFNRIDDIIPLSLYNNEIYINLTKGVLFLLGDKDMYMIYSVLFYTLVHPFTAIKVIFATHSTEFIIVLLRCLFQNQRPRWLLAEKAKAFLCPFSYSNPSLNFFFFTFFIIYLILAKLMLRRKKRRLGFVKKFLISFVLGIFLIIFGVILMVNRLNYFYQIVFTFTISLVFICLCVDLEINIHNILHSSIKNVYKIRKNKIRLFIFILAINILGLVLYTILPDNSINELQKVVAKTVK
jgi:hypothetical protein